MSSVFALVPAAGLSTRMGQPKLSLPLGAQTVIEHLVQTLVGSGIEKVLVVVGPHTPELVPLATSAGSEVLAMREATPDMRSTIDAGWRWIESNWRPADDDAFLLVPADHPVLSGGVIRELLAAWMGNGIVIPTFDGRRGHPTLIGWNHVAAIRAMPANLGLNAYLRQHADAVREAPVASETILIDLDTPEDYERVKKMLEGA